MRIEVPRSASFAVVLAAVILPTVGAYAADELAVTPNVCLRGSLQNSQVAFAIHQQGRVAFLGGSITEMEGFRPLVCAWLKQRFPHTEFTFINAGIASTCSTTGAFRLQDDVLKQGPIDLLFVEFAVNDDQDAAHTRPECIRGMEGIVRHARQQNANIDIVITYFVNPEMLATLQAGQTPLPIAAHEDVARHYAIPTVNLAKEVAEEITAGKLTWQQYGGVHPARPGNALCAAMIGQLLDAAWRQPPAAGAAKVAHPLPTEPSDGKCYSQGRFVDPKLAQVKRGWTLHVPDWKKLPGAARSRFTGIPMLCAEQPGAELTLDFTGTAVGAYVVAGPDAGIVVARVDDGPPCEVDLYHRFSKGLHYPRTVIFAADLAPGKHTLSLSTSAKTNSAGHAARIIEFTAN